MTFPFKFVYYILTFNVIWDFLSIFYDDIAVLPMIRGLVILVFGIYVIFHSPNNRIRSAFILFAVYISILIPFSDDIQYSFTTSIKVFSSLMMLPVGFFLIRDWATLRNLSRSIYWLAFVIVIGFVLFNLFDVGGETYTDKIDFDVGTQSDNWNVLTYTLLVSPLFLVFNRSYVKRLTMNLMLFVLCIFLFISLKRIAITGLVFGFLVISLSYGNFGQSLRVALLTLVVFVGLSPLYLPTVEVVYEARQDRFEEGALKKEARYLETFEVWEEVFRFENPIKSFFGGQAFNSIGTYAQSGYGRRMLHVDYNLILNTNGLVGLMLYLNIYLQVILVFFRSPLRRFPQARMFKSVFLALFCATLFTSLAGQLYAISFRSIAFLFMGAVLGYMSSKPIENERIKSVSLAKSVYR